MINLLIYIICIVRLTLCDTEQVMQDTPQSAMHEGTQERRPTTPAVDDGSGRQRSFKNGEELLEGLVVSSDRTKSQHSLKPNSFKDTLPALGQLDCEQHSHIYSNHDKSRPEKSSPFLVQHPRHGTNYSKVSNRLRKAVTGNSTSLNDELQLASSLDPDRKPKPRDVLLQQALLHNTTPFSVRNFKTSTAPAAKPYSSPNRRSADITELDVHGLGLGDEKVVVLSESLHCCPKVTTINIAGNRLTDRSVQPFLEQMLLHLHCTSLDVSDNKMDAASITILKQNLKDPSCKIRTLKLRKSDIDDNECTDLMEAVAGNKSVTSLTLADNLIGQY